MRGFSKLAAGPRPNASRALITSTSSPFFSPAASYSSGRGRGRGELPRGPGAPPAADAEDPGVPVSSVHAQGYGRGRGRGHPILPSPPTIPAFSYLSPIGRGRGAPLPPADADSGFKKPIFSTRDGSSLPVDQTRFADSPLPSPLPVRGATGAGRGKPIGPIEPGAQVMEENRHVRHKEPTVDGSSAMPSPTTKMTREEAVKRAVEVLSHGGRGGRGGRGTTTSASTTGGRAMGRGGRGFERGRDGRGRGRGRSQGRRRGGGRHGEHDEESEDITKYLGDKNAGERVEKILGKEKMKVLESAFEEACSSALPSPFEEAYLNAQHMNNMIEYEPEYLVEIDNPDIDETPPMPLEEVLRKVKPFFMMYAGLQSNEEWDEAVKDLMERLPYMKELMDIYCGPDRVTAKQQQQELVRVANTLPENVPTSVRNFTDRAVLSLQSNPGWGWNKKCQFMDKLVWEVKEHYK